MYAINVLVIFPKYALTVVMNITIGTSKRTRRIHIIYLYIIIAPKHLNKIKHTVFFVSLFWVGMNWKHI